MFENSARSASGIRQRILYLADFVIVPLAIAVLVNVAGLTRFPLIAVGFAVWTLAEYLLHRFALQAVLKAQINKTDRNDARGIAQMMRVGLYRPVHVKTLRSQKLRMLLT